MFKIKFADGWDKYYLKLDKTEKMKIWKKIEQLKTQHKTRHLRHGLPFFIFETGQYRICFEEEKDARIVAFAGSHKQYEKW
ncbi:MAG: hypothetical protein V1911_02000, partial [Candidatus Micrarchaeota archaeon]